MKIAGFLVEFHNYTKQWVQREIPLTLAATLTLHNKYTSTSSNYSIIVQKKDFNAGLHLN